VCFVDLSPYSLSTSPATILDSMLAVGHASYSSARSNHRQRPRLVAAETQNPAARDGTADGLHPQSEYVDAGAIPPLDSCAAPLRAQLLSTYFHATVFAASARIARIA
jgi:hypothetical protein